MDEALTVLEQAVDVCLVVPLWARSPEVVVGYLDRVQGLEQQLAALKLALVRDVDGRGVALQQARRTWWSWLRDRYRVSAGVATRAVLLCRHHHLIHHSQWEVKIVNQLPVFIPPSYLGEKRQPLTNPIHRRRSTKISR